MSSFTESHPFIYSLYCIICVLPFVIPLPVTPKDDPFDKFIEFLSSNNCSMPKEIELPFFVNDTVPFSYLNSPLEECKSSDAVKENNEASLLCREIFEVIQNITCVDYKLNNSKIESGELSSDVCHEFAAIQDIIPKQNEFLSRKFGDGIICKVMCTEKYEFLCKVLLWGYNTQAKLKNSTLEKNVATEAEENLESHPDSNEIPADEITSTLEKPKKVLNKDIGVPDGKTTSTLEKPKETLNKDIETPNEKITSDEKPKKTINKDSSINNTALDAEPKTHTADESAKAESNLPATENKIKESENHEEKPKKIDTPKTDSEKVDESIKASKIIVIQPQTEEASKSSNDLSEQNQNIRDDKNNDLDENTIEMPSKSSNKNDKVNVPTVDVNISASDAKSNKKTDVDTPTQGEGSKVDVTDNKEKIKNVPSPAVPKTEEENDLKKTGQENVKPDEAKETQADLDSQGEDPKENEIPNGESDSNLSEPTVSPIFPDKSDDFEPQPELKDPEQYNDSENDGDYAKQEYDTAFNTALKKESNVKNTVNDVPSQFSSGSNMPISNENFVGHESDINRNFLPARNYLPDQEDSHFFFYFLTIVLVLMAGYLIFHNKQKIIALIVEGRHERRRRSHGAGYKKLETK